MSQICDRCGSPTNIFTMSYFNTDSLCEECDVLEQLHPDYHAAKAAELEQVEKLNFNYEGIGLPVGYREWARAKKAELAASEDTGGDVVEVELTEVELTEESLLDALASFGGEDE